MKRISAAATAAFLVVCSGTGWAGHTALAAAVVRPSVAAGAVAPPVVTRPQVAAAFRAIEELEPLSLATLIELTEIPAPPFMEQARAARYAELLAEAGADSVWIDEVGNVIGLRLGRGGDRTVSLEGHLDTVWRGRT